MKKEVPEIDEWEKEFLNSLNDFLSKTKPELLDKVAYQISPYTLGLSVRKQIQKHLQKES